MLRTGRNPGGVQGELGGPVPRAPSSSTGAEAAEPVPDRGDSALAQAAARQRWNLVRIERLLRASRSRFDFTTAGSSGRRPADLLGAARRLPFDAAVLVDARDAPFSRHTPDWNGPALRRTAEDHGLEYLHRPDLGVPREVRRELAAGTIDLPGLHAWYDREVATPARIGELRPLLARRPIFLCTELSPVHCHRSRLAVALERTLDVVSFDL